MGLARLAQLLVARADAIPDHRRNDWLVVHLLRKNGEIVWEYCLLNIASDE